MAFLPLNTANRAQKTYKKYMNEFYKGQAALRTTTHMLLLYGTGILMTPKKISVSSLKRSLISSLTSCCMTMQNTVATFPKDLELAGSHTL